MIDLVRTILAAVGSSWNPKMLNPDAPFEEEHLDNSKARALLGWTPQYDLAAGVRETAQWFSESPLSPLQSPSASAAKNVLH